MWRCVSAMRSIQTKLTITIMAILLVALGTLGGLNYWKARQIITETITQDMTVKANNSASEIGDWLEARKGEIRMMATGPVILSGNKEAMVPFLKGATESNPAYESISYADVNGEAITQDGFKLSMADRDYIRRALQGETVISDPIISKVTKLPITAVATPVKSGEQITGVLYGIVKLDSVTAKVLEIKTGRTGTAYVLQADGLSIIHPDKEKMMKENSLTDEKVPQSVKAINQRVVKGENGIGSYEYNGVDKWVAFAPIPGVKWFIAINVPKDEVAGAVSELTVISMVMIVVVLVVAALIIMWFSRRIARPIQMLEKEANRIATGDISQHKLNIVSNDEIGRLGRSFEKMTENLRELIRKVLGATEQVAASSEELTASSEQSAQAASQVAESVSGIAQGAEKNLNAVNETSAVVEQMSAGIQQVAASANQVADNSAHAVESAKEGDKSVEKAVSQMASIEQTVNNSAQVVNNLGERSKEIGQIVDTISGIAGQTNLLALNAAIEAARAGEQGKGFAVVAEEVRKLAEQSQDAAQHIATLISEIQTDTDKAVVAMSEGTREVKEGTEVVTAAGQAFKEIAASVTRAAEQVKEISATMQQMSSGSQQIVTSVKRIDELSKTAAEQAQAVSAATEEQSASMEEIASSSQSLARLAQDLQSVAGKFQI